MEINKFLAPSTKQKQPKDLHHNLTKMLGRNKLDGVDITQNTLLSEYFPLAQLTLNPQLRNRGQPPPSTYGKNRLA